MRKPTCEANLFAKLSFAAFVLVTLVTTGGASAQELQLADLGECELESGEVIRGCVVGYRTVGELNADSSNAVLFPAWGGGTSEDLHWYIGPDGFVDPDVHFVIAVDLFGNGVASSPSNSSAQPGHTFPQFTVRDMVRSQHRLATEVLQLDGLHAVLGISLGALVAFEWVTTYPGFVAKAVPVVGTPLASPHDLMAYDLGQRILSGCEPDRCDQARETMLAFRRLMLRTPENRNRTLTRDEVPALLTTIPEGARSSGAATDQLYQWRALSAMDVTAPFGGSMERAAAAVEADMLIVVATRDLITTPESSREFARLTGAQLYESDSDCGHQAFFCEEEEIAPLVRAFLQE